MNSSALTTITSITIHYLLIILFPTTTNRNNKIANASTNSAAGNTAFIVFGQKAKNNNYNRNFFQTGKSFRTPNIPIQPLSLEPSLIHQLTALCKKQQRPRQQQRTHSNDLWELSYSNKEQQCCCKDSTMMTMYSSTNDNDDTSYLDNDSQQAEKHDNDKKDSTKKNKKNGRKKKGKYVEKSEIETDIKGKYITLPAVEAERNYWNDADDEFILTRFSTTNANGDDHDTITNAPTTNDRINRKKVQFIVRGNPSPLQRHRTSRGFMYNPSKAKEEEFRNVVLDMMLRMDNNPIVFESNKDDEQQLPYSTPLFKKDELISMKIVFRMKRPKSHFIGNKPGNGRLRSKHDGKILYPSIRSDVDNLAKFVLDSLNEFLYEDDRQVVSLSATKVLDWEGCCVGATEVIAETLLDEDMVEFQTMLKKNSVVGK